MKLFRKKRTDKDQPFLNYAPNLSFRSRSIDLERDAREEGKCNRPGQSETELNTAQQLVVDHFAAENAKLGDFATTSINQKQRTFYEGVGAGHDSALPTILADANLSIQKERVRASGKLAPLCRSEQQASRDLRAFCDEHRRVYAARYPDSFLWHFAIVFVVVVGESLANMYFFAQGNELGLLGGVLQSLLVSLANVGVSLGIGAFGLPQLNHVAVGRRFIGIAALMLFLAFVPSFNLITAHYRDLLAEDYTTALAKALPDTLETPFQLSFDSLMLFVVGLLAAGLALYKGYTVDDPYPGYGKQTRLHVQAKRAFDEKVDEVRNALISIIDGMQLQTDSVLKESEKRLRLLADTVADIRRIVDHYSANRTGIESECKRYLKHYREINKRVRDEACPDYFNVFPRFEPAPAIVTVGSEFIKNADQTIEQGKNEHARLSQEVKDLKEGLAQRVAQAARELDESLEELANAVGSSLEKPVS